jgi:hypothetical protein
MARCVCATALRSDLLSVLWRVACACRCNAWYKSCKALAFRLVPLRCCLLYQHTLAQRRCCVEVFHTRVPRNTTAKHGMLTPVVTCWQLLTSQLLPHAAASRFFCTCCCCVASWHCIGMWVLWFGGYKSIYLGMRACCESMPAKLHASCCADNAVHEVSCCCCAAAGLTSVWKPDF